MDNFEDLRQIKTKKFLSPYEINNIIKDSLDSSFELKNVWLKAEISNLVKHSSGHLYFSLKDDKSEIRCTMWKFQAAKFISTINKLKDGDEIEVLGTVEFYLPKGSCSFSVKEISLSGTGDLWQKYEQLKLKLKNEGLFDIENKKQIPLFPETIGIITSFTGAAIHDMIQTIKRRWPICEIKVFPCAVQGDEAKTDIVNKIKLANQHDLDVIILGRGGGSIEDLWSFNEEIVARAIYNSRTPIISAVGHESDFTIADFVADYRAATPTAAAEIATTNDISSVNGYINDKNKQLIEKVEWKVDLTSSNIRNIHNHLERFEPSQLIKNYLLHINSIKKELNYKTKQQFIEVSNQYKSQISKLEMLNPLNILKRGYSVVKKDNKIINSISNVKLNEKLNIIMCDGEIETTITNKKEGNKHEK